MELARLIGQSDPFGQPPGRGPEAPRAPDLPTRGPMARPPSRDISPRSEQRSLEEEPAYEARPARGHPFPWLQVPPKPVAPAESREPSYGGAQEERAYQEPTYPEPSHQEAYREPPPYAEPQQPAYAPGGYERHEPTFGTPDEADEEHGHYGHGAGSYPTVPDQNYAAEHSADHYAADPAPGREDHYPRLDDRQHYAADSHEGQHGEHAEHDPRYAAGERDAHGENDPRYAEEGEHDEHGEHDPRYAAAQADEDEYDDEYEYADDEGGYDDEPKRRNLVKVALAGVLGVLVVGTAGAFGYRALFHSGGSDAPPPLIRADNTPTKVVPTPTADASAKPINDRLGSGERMVSREEQPIDLRDARNANGALVAPVGTGGVAPYPTAPTTTSAAPASTPTEPKRVRTVTIHADAGTQPAPNGAAAPAQTTPAAAGTGTRPSAAPRPAAPPASSANAPMSLTPQAPPAVAAVETTHPAAPARATPPSGSGGWIVQISAQKTEAEAQAAFRTAQAKYSALANYQPLIRKKDQGERGVFYATQVGPFTGREEANQLCETLKSAGGSCFIQRN
jgi:hypothetical protein